MSSSSSYRGCKFCGNRHHYSEKCRPRKDHCEDDYDKDCPKGPRKKCDRREDCSIDPCRDHVYRPCDKPVVTVCHDPCRKKRHDPHCKCQLCFPCEGLCETPWPPICDFPPADTVHPKHLFVPGDHDTIGEALDSLNNEQAGYVIHLKSGTHTLARDHNSDVKFLRLEGDCNPVKGVGYIHLLGQWNQGLAFDEQYNSNVGGLAPWELCVKPKRITVKGFKDPCFDSLKCGDRLVFQHKAGHTTEHRICRGHRHHIFLHDCLILDQDQIQQGEGFYIKPNVCLKTCRSQKLLVEHRLEYGGIHFDTNPLFITGATGGHTEVEHSVIGCDMTHVGRMDWYKPNVVTGQLTLHDSSNGTAFYQTVLGCRASVTAHANPMTQYAMAMFVGNRSGVTLKNGGQINTTFSDFCENQVAASSSSDSKHDIRGSRFFKCETAIKLRHASSAFSESTHGMAKEIFTPEFHDCGVAIDLDFNSHHIAEDLILDSNTTDLLLDGVIKHPLPGAHPSGTYGVKFSTIIYDIINPV